MKASLFVTCLVDNFFPQVADVMVRLMNRYGVTVDLPDRQTCCGQPAFNSGYEEEARKVGFSLLEAFEDSDYVVAPSGSCSGMVHHYFPDLFKGDAKLSERVRKLNLKTYEFSQFMVNVLGVTDVGATFPHRVTYHPSCHATRIMGAKEEPLQLLKNVRGIELVELSHKEDCCGFGGTFAIKMPDISAAMVAEKAEHVMETNAEVLVGIDMGCMMNIGGRLRHENKPVRVMHLAELLYEGLQHEGVSV